MLPFYMLKLYELMKFRTKLLSNIFKIYQFSFNARKLNSNILKFFEFHAKYDSTQKYECTLCLQKFAISFVFNFSRDHWERDSKTFLMVNFGRQTKSAMVIFKMANWFQRLLVCDVFLFYRNINIHSTRSKTFAIKRNIGKLFLLVKFSS